MTIEASFNYPSDLNASYPAASDSIPEGDDHIRGIKSVLKTTLPNVSGVITPTHTQLNTVPDLAPKASPALTGVPTAPTAAVGTATTQIATTAFVAATALVSALPGQVGNSGKTITTDGTNASWTDSLTSTVMRWVDGADTTKKLAFGLSGITTGTTRTVTLPNKDGTMAMLGDAASQAEMEAASSTTTFVTPGRAQFHPGVAKAWLQCDAAGTVDVSHNITSITDDGTGQVTVTIATDFSSANFVALCSPQSDGDLTTAVTSKAAGSATFKCWNSAGSLTDPSRWNVAFLGDQA